MRPVIALALALALALAGLPLIGGGARAHDGHDHGAPPSPVSGTIAPRADATSADFELVVVGRAGTLILYLDAFTDNRPIDGARIEIDSPAGLLQPRADGPGRYTVAAPFVDRPGRYDLAVTIAAGDTVDVLAATLVVPPPVAGPERSRQARYWGIDPAIAQDLGQRVRGTDVTVLAGIGGGFAIGVAVASLFWRRRRLAAACAMLLLLLGLLPGETGAAEPGPAVAARDVSQRLPDGALFVPKPTQRILGLRTLMTRTAAHRRAIELPGRIIPDPNASGLVQASVGGRLFPPPGGFKPLGTAVKAGDILAYVRPPIGAADLTTQQQQARELDQQISVVTRKLERLRAIEKVIARGQIEDAALELQGLQARRANLDRANKEPEPLLAPVDGVIAASNVVAGQMAEPNSIIFQIVDPTRLWVEALSFEPQTPDGLAQGLFAGGRTVELTYVGTGLADRNQSVPIHFAIRGDATGLRAGQFLTVLARTSEVRTGLAVPREAVLRGSNGQSIVYEHAGAERFIPREVRIEQLDAAHVLIVAGIEPGRRIVTQGAELLNQIR